MKVSLQIRWVIRASCFEPCSIGLRSRRANLREFVEFPRWAAV